MGAFFVYILKASVYLAILYLFYSILLINLIPQKYYM